MAIADTPFVHLELLDSGILVASYKPSKVIDLNMAKEIVEARLDFVGREPRPVLVLNLDVLAFNWDARRYVSSGEGIVGVKAAASVRDQLSTALIMSLIIKIEKPPFPYQEFIKKEAGEGRLFCRLIRSML